MSTNAGDRFPTKKFAMWVQTQAIALETSAITGGRPDKNKHFALGKLFPPAVPAPQQLTDYGHVDAQNINFPKKIVENPKNPEF